MQKQLLAVLMWISVLGVISSVLAYGLIAMDPAMKLVAGAGNIFFGLGVIISRHFLRDKKEEETTGESGIEHDFD